MKNNIEDQQPTNKDNLIDKNLTPLPENQSIPMGFDDSLSKGLDNSNIIYLQSQILSVINSNVNNEPNKEK